MAGVGGGGGGVSEGPNSGSRNPQTGLYNQPSDYNMNTGAAVPHEVPGMRWNPQTGSYERTPAAQGGDVNQFANGAVPGLPNLLGPGGSGTGSGGGIPGLGGSGGGGPVGTLGTGPAMSSLQRVAGLAPPDASAATNAAFATAKDQSGAAARAALDSLRGELGATGNLGSGAEVQGTRDIVGTALGVEGQAARDEASKNADVSADFAKTKYTGEIAQRGQDVAQQEAQARLAFEQRQAAADQQMRLLTLALGSLGNLGRPAATPTTSSTSSRSTALY